MGLNDLIELINGAFKNNLPPEIDNISSGKHEEAALVRKVFADKKWNELTKEFMATYRQDISFLSNEAFYYFLPAFLNYIINDFYDSDTLADSVINRLTLPNDLDTISLTYYIKKHQIDKDISDIDFEFFFNQQIEGMNKSIARFVELSKMFNDVQGRATKKFLIYIIDTYGEEYKSSITNPKTAHDRYWFVYE